MFSSQVSQLDASPHFAPSYRTAAAAAPSTSGDGHNGIRIGGSPRGPAPAPAPAVVACISAGLDGIIRSWPLSVTTPVNDDETAAAAASTAINAATARDVSASAFGLTLQPLPPVLMLGTPQVLRFSSNSTAPSVTTSSNTKAREERIGGAAVRN